MKVLGIEFAPLMVPMHRRYETLAVASWFFLAAFGGLTSLLVSLYLLFTRLWWLVPLYTTWTYLDRHVGESGGRTNVWVQNWRWWYHLKNYFPRRN
jgi:2-acylglycerol O-acyltransferase 2